MLAKELLNLLFIMRQTTRESQCALHIRLESSKIEINFIENWEMDYF